MNPIRRLEKEKENQSARMTDGFSQNVSLSQGLVEGGMGFAGGISSGSHGLVIPWMGNPHIKIVVSAE